MKIKFAFFILTLPLTLAAETALEEFITGNNVFTESVYNQLKHVERGNFLVSPFSAEAVLALTHSGAKDETAEEIRTSLNLPDTKEKIEAAIKSLQPSLRQSGLYTLQSVNKIYLKDDFEIKDSFQKVANEVFGAGLEKIDFKERTAAAQHINKWVEDRTEHKIKELVSPDKLNDRTRTVLVNALYFKGNWSDPFAKYATAKEGFYRDGRDPIQVDTMHDTSHRRYFESEVLDAKFLELDFEGGDLTMTIVLPNKNDGLDVLEGNLGKLLDKPPYTNERVRVSLPKFKIETGVDFKPILQHLGVKKAFSDAGADLSGIAGEKGDLVIDQVAQKAFIDVGEEGVEAAAASFVSVGVPLSGFFPATPPKEFKADHPFVFYIKKNGLVLFTGRVTDPRL